MTKLKMTAADLTNLPTDMFWAYHTDMFQAYILSPQQFQQLFDSEEYRGTFIA